MLHKDILCATDLSPASTEALRMACAVATRSSGQVTLLHVLTRGEHDADGRERVLATMQEQVKSSDASGCVTVKLLDGDPMKVIAGESGNDHGLLVLGTHGARGLRQNLFGTDILKLVRHAATPSIVVQEGMKHDAPLKRIVLPVASHADIDKLLDAVESIATAFGAEVHIFQLIRPGEQPSAELLANKVKMLDRLSGKGIVHQEVNEPGTAFSIGFAEGTIRYADRVGAGAIAIMAHASDEYRYMADAEKERILTNEPRIPVICA